MDWEASRKRLELAQEIFGGILQIEQRTSFWWSLGIMIVWAQLRGLEQVMLDMVTEPEWTHRAVQFISDGRLHMLDDLERQGLLSLNNGNHYIGSGSFGFTNELPAPGFEPGHVRTRDMWGFTEGQEITGVSPAMHWEFALQYEVPIHARFGLTWSLSEKPSMIITTNPEKRPTDNDLVPERAITRPQRGCISRMN